MNPKIDPDSIPPHYSQLITGNYPIIIITIIITIIIIGACGNVVVKSLCYRPEGSGFETR
jgi:hypothetical protein